MVLTATAPAALTSSFAELDVQVYEGEGAVGIIVSELNSGFDVALDENSKVIVSGTNVSDGAGSTTTNTTTNEEEVIINATAVVEEVIEIPHIGNITDNGVGENDTSVVQNNVTSSTEVINDVTGGNITEPAVVVTENETSVERDCIGGILTEGYSEPTDFEICYI